MTKLFLTSILCLSGIFVYADDNPAQKIECIGNTCNLYALTNQGPKLITSGKESAINQYYSGWTDKASGLAAFSIDCGTECNYGYFVNYQTGQVSDNMYLVEDVNIVKGVVVLPNPDDNNDQSLLVRPIFNCTKGIIIERSFDPDVENAINKINFDKNGNLYLDYLTTPNYTEVKETVPIDYARIQKKCSDK